MNSSLDSNILVNLYKYKPDSLPQEKHFGNTWFECMDTLLSRKIHKFLSLIQFVIEFWNNVLLGKFLNFYRLLKPYVY